jgi:hypothetical protein
VIHDGIWNYAGCANCELKSKKCGLKLQKLFSHLFYSYMWKHWIRLRDRHLLFLFNEILWDWQTIELQGNWATYALCFYLLVFTTTSKLTPYRRISKRVPVMEHLASTASPVFGVWRWRNYNTFSHPYSHASSFFKRWLLGVEKVGLGLKWTRFRLSLSRFICIVMRVNECPFPSLSVFVSFSHSHANSLSHTHAHEHA